MKKAVGFFMSLVFSLVSVAAHTGDDFYGHHSMMGYTTGMGIYGWIFMLLVVVALVLLIVWLIKEIQKK